MPYQFHNVAYLVAAVCFIFSLGGLSQHESARRGNLLGIIGIVIAIAATIFSGLIQGSAFLLVPSLIIGAVIGTLVALLVITLLSINPFGLIPEVLRGVLTVLAAFAIAVLIFDSLWSLLYDWLPFVQDNTVHTVLMNMDLTIEPQPE